MTTQAKSFEFPVSVHWVGGKRTIASVEGKPDLEVATPPEFRGGVEGVWSPEDLLVGSIGSCFAVTLVAIAERRDIPLHGLGVSARGRVTQRNDGRTGFVEATIDVTLMTDPGHEEEAVAAAEAAERSCLVAASLDFPVRLALDVRAAEPAGASR
jgi:organic hydroperoxide reductase OsmC/OhrA